MSSSPETNYSVAIGRFVNTKIQIYGTDAPLSNESRTTISKCLRSMLLRDPLSRPSAFDLLERFRQNYDQMSHIPISPNKGTVSQLISNTRSDRGNAVVDCGTESHQAIPVKKVLNTIVNKLNDRIVIPLSDEDRTQFRMELWKTDPLELLFNFRPTLELGHIPVSNLKKVCLAFTDDGKYLCVCFAQRVKVWDAQTADLFKAWTLPNWANPMSVSIHTYAQYRRTVILSLGRHQPLKVCLLKRSQAAALMLTSSRSPNERTK